MNTAPRSLSLACCLGLVLTLASCEADDAYRANEAGAAAPSAATAPMDRLPDDEAGAVVRRAIAYAGGWDAWAALRTLDYQKTRTWHDADGTEHALVQHHQYQMQPEMKMRIAYRDPDGHDILLINNAGAVGKWIDGAPATAQPDRDNAWNATFGSHYVMGMPFKLTDPGTLLSYAGRDTLDGVVVDAVQVDYEEGAGSAGGFHTWTYYFEAGTGRLVANHLRYGPNPGDHDITVYTEVRPIEGVHLSIRRDGYHSNAQKERLAHTSSYVNSDIRVNAPLPDALFALDR